jgi:hypothetical protein
MQRYNKIVCAIFIIALLILGQKYKDTKAQKQYLESIVDDYSYALSRANDNIEEANSMIEDAQSYIWSDYEEMRYALDSLETVDTISEP